MAEFHITGVDRAVAVLGTRPYPKCPNSVAYAKWVAVQKGDVWYIGLGGWAGYHASLVALVVEENGLGGSEFVEHGGTIHQPRGPGTEITVTQAQEGQVPAEVLDRIRRSLVAAQRHGGVR